MFRIGADGSSFSDVTDPDNNTDGLRGDNEADQGMDLNNENFTISKMLLITNYKKC